jgi:3-deoxy-D-manno-octulosonate 8-phosphate phosphatase (KDO 8-P phosphatase)
MNPLHSGPSMTLKERCAAVEWLVLDVDGVLTEGAITYAGAVGTDQGGEIKSFHVRDGSALVRWHAAGKRSAVITGRRSEVVKRRAAELGVGHVFQGATDKRAVFDALLADQRLAARAVCYVGDDGPDGPVLARAGLAVAVADASPGARALAHYITRAEGGRGAVAEVVSLLLGCQGSSRKDEG